jgi:hypothetical protein
MDKYARLAAFATGMLGIQKTAEDKEPEWMGTKPDADTTMNDFSKAERRRLSRMAGARGPVADVLKRQPETAAAEHATQRLHGKGYLPSRESQATKLGLLPEGWVSNRQMRNASGLREYDYSRYALTPRQSFRRLREQGVDDTTIGFIKRLIEMGAIQASAKPSLPSRPVV